jgi:hypothetical protein
MVQHADGENRSKQKHEKQNYCRESPWMNAQRFPNIFKMKIVVKLWPYLHDCMSFRLSFEAQDVKGVFVGGIVKRSPMRCQS